MTIEHTRMPRGYGRAIVLLLVLTATDLGCSAGGSRFRQSKASTRSIDSDKVFQQRDVNEDGFLTLEEFKRGARSSKRISVEDRFELLDADGDELVSQSEFKDGVAKLKSKMKGARKR